MTYAYYSPGVGTVPNPNPLGMPSGPVVCTGEAISAVVACDLGRAVVGVIDGVEAWRRSYPSSWPRGIEIFEGLLFVAEGTSIHVMNPKTGFVHRTMTVPNAPAPINGLSITRDGNQVYLVACFDAVGAGTVRAYNLSGLSLTEVFVNPHSAAHPRHAQYKAGWVFVCDTFGHRVYAVTMAGAMRDSVEIYFPNHIDMQASNWGLIAAEHENRVVRWQYYPTVSFTLEVAAPVAPFNDAAKRKTDIIAAEASTFDPASAFSPPKSLCAQEAQGDNTLYSPNSARMYGSDVLVSDTDNHAVKLFRGGVVVSKITGFNNPVTSLMI